MVSLLSVSYFSQNPDLLAKWTFSGRANDSSGNDNTLTVYNATLTKDRFGEDNRAYYFNGTDAYLEGSVKNLPVGNSNRTITGWFKSDFNGAGYYFTIFNYGTAANFQNLGASLYSKGYLNIDWNLVTGGEYINNHNYINNTWYFFAMTYDGSKVRIYTNGTLAGTYSVNLDTKTTGNLLRIGKRVDPQTDYFKGSIDDIEIYGKALTDNEVSALYQSQLSAIETSATKNVILYPNPAKDFVNLDNLSKNATVKITDATGKLIYTSVSKDTSLKISTSDLASGIYFLEVNNNGKTASKKFIVRK